MTASPGLRLFCSVVALAAGSGAVLIAMLLLRSALG